MHPSLKELIGPFVDFAGMMAPANLEPAIAHQTYLEYADGSDAWILGRLVCPASQLMPLAEAMLNAPPGLPVVPVAVLGTYTEDYDGWYPDRDLDAGFMNEFEQSVGERAEIESYEVRLPDYGHSNNCLDSLGALRDIDVFVELPWGDGLEEGIAAIAERDWLFAKAHTGIASRRPLPATKDLARFLTACLGLEVPFKITAGMHTLAVGETSPEAIRMHGLVNLLGSAAIGLADDLNVREMAHILDLDQPSAWRNVNGELGWDERTISGGEIREARTLFRAFGSCSIEEPLVALEILGFR